MSITNTDPMIVLQAFFDRLGAGGHVKDAIDEFIADDCVWENSGLPTAKGKAAVHAQIDGFIDGFGLHALVVDTLAVAANGENVLTERIDHVDTADGTRALSLTMAGIFRIVDGKIVRWSDYFDPRPLLP